MEPIDIDAVAARLDGETDLFAEPLREESLSVGVYRLAAGATDPQEPHAEDEAYYVLSGQGKLRIDETVHDLDPGDLVYVERGVDHEFFDITAELTTLVFFAPAYGSLETT
jgi:quercetin dioxygenase-like cupin family protein